jgi:outer membrane protein OmpA-like peptidoglycan-associated protein
MLKLITPFMLFLLTSCSQFPPVKDRDVPTAFFVFFDENSAQAVDGSDKVLDEVAGFLKFYDDLTVIIIGQRARSETSDATDGSLDAQRARFVAGQLQVRGVTPKRMSVGSKGVSESMANEAGGEESVDRRVDIMVRIVSGQQ